MEKLISSDKKEKKAKYESPNTLTYYFSMTEKFAHLPIHKFSLMYFFGVATVHCLSF